MEKARIKFALRFGLEESDLKDLPSIEKYPITNLGTSFNHAVKDKSFLLSQLNATKDRPQFIGLESYSLDIVFLKHQYEILIKELSRIRSSMSLNDSEINDFLLSGSMGHVHTYLEYPELTRDIPLVNIEGISALETISESKEDKTMRALENLIKENKIYLNSLSVQEQKYAKEQLKYFINTLFDFFIKDQYQLKGVEDFNQLKNKLYLSVPHWLKNFIREFIVPIIKKVDLTYLRDVQSVENMASRNQTGIHFVGLLHLEPQSKLLAKLCQKELLTLKKFSRQSSSDNRFFLEPSANLSEMDSPK